MSKRMNTFFKKLIWCFPATLAFFGILYYINLFDRIEERNILRQSEEKYQLISFVENLNTRASMVRAMNIMDRFEDTHTYLLNENLDRVVEKYHAQGCSFRIKPHPYEDRDLRKKMLSTKTGTFIYNGDDNKKRFWEYRWIVIENEKYLILVGVSNYPLDPLDKELQISIGILLLLTALLNWGLVGYTKYIRMNPGVIDEK